MASVHKRYSISIKTIDYIWSLLAISDGDIIRKFIEAEKKKTTIIYHAIGSLSTAVENLSAILDMNDLICRTSGEKLTLEFQSQKEYGMASASYNAQ